jgi:nucleoside-diphosphate-sugar epimerase
MSAILLFGHTGFIGKNLSSYLVTKNHQVTTLSLRNEKLDNSNSNDIYINLIGKAHDHSGKATENDFFYANYELTREIFENFIQSQATLFLQVSSIAAVEEKSHNGILDENQVSKPTTAYGRSKHMAEEYLINFDLPPNKKIVIIRPTMVHGPGDKGNLTLLYKIVSKGIPYPLGMFKNQRSFLSVDNLNFIIEKIIEKKQTILSGVYNIADDQPLSTEEIIQIIGIVSNKECRVWNIPKLFIYKIARLGDFFNLPLNTKRLGKMTSNLVVSNQKIKEALQIKNLPITAQEGLEITIKSFAK